MRRTHFKGKHIDLERHISALGYLMGSVYENCTLVGPATLMFEDDCIIENLMVANKATKREVFLCVPPNIHYRGLWRASKCVLKDCELVLVTIVSTENRVPRLQRSITVFEPPEVDTATERDSAIMRWRDEVRRIL